MERKCHFPLKIIATNIVNTSSFISLRLMLLLVKGFEPTAHKWEIIKVREKLKV